MRFYVEDAFTGEIIFESDNLEDSQLFAERVFISGLNVVLCDSQSSYREVWGGCGEVLE